MIKKLLLSVLAIFGFAVLFSQNSYAVSGTSYTLNSSNANGIVFCDDTTDTKCSDFGYAVIDISSWNPGAGGSWHFQFKPIGYGWNDYYIIGSSTLYQVLSLSNMDYFGTFSSGFAPSTAPTGWSITVTLTNESPFNAGGITPTGTINISENGTYDVTQYASAVVDVPQTVEGEGSFIVNLFKGGFWNVATAIVGLIVPVLALFLVFRLIHGLIYGKGV